MQNKMRLALVTCLFLILTACAFHVTDEGLHQARGHSETITHCAVTCPDSGQASVSCELDQIPACQCQPAPVAVCKTRDVQYF